ncbi:hypothetical protein UPYG_G00076890 [Umbra pygmaea]|uniref:HECT domain-containing protein n=1 Tax=Umbra pygmaea TaxID=75934 RepID=A0ABD0XCW1_UMBPY
MAQALLTAISRASNIPPNLHVTSSQQPCTPPNTPTQTCQTTTTPTTTINTRINQSLKRQFPNMFQSKSEMKRGKSRFCSSARVFELAHAGLGKRVVSVPEDSKHTEIVSLMEEEFLKIRPLGGRWMFFKGTGGNGQRKLSIVPMDTEGYSVRQLQCCIKQWQKCTLLVPLQEELDTEPLPYNAAEFAKDATGALPHLQYHNAPCKCWHFMQRTANKQQNVCPICQKVFPTSVLPLNGSVCAERSFSNDRTVEPDMEVPGPSLARVSVARSAHYLTPLAPVATAWKKADTPKEAMQLFLEELRQGGEDQPHLLLSLDARDNDEERESTLISFYKEMREKCQWTAPFNCRILGDAAVGVGVARHTLSSTMSKLKHGFKLNLGNAAVTTMFEGQTDHPCLPCPQPSLTVTCFSWLVILQSITWPKSKQLSDSEDSDDDISAGTISLISGFLQTFVEEASTDVLRQLLKFWIGWEVPSNTLKLEIVNSHGRNHLPTSSTCYERLRIPNHYTSYSALKVDLMVCLQSVETGFGLV